MIFLGKCCDTSRKMMHKLLTWRRDGTFKESKSLSGFTGIFICILAKGKPLAWVKMELRVKGVLIS